MIQYPLDLDDHMITLDQLCGLPRRTDSEPSTTMSGAIHMFKLHRVWSRIHTLLFAGNRDPLKPVDATDIALLRVELDTWKENIPKQTSWTLGGSSLWVSGDWFNLSYYHSILLLYRNQITTQDTATDDPTSISIFLECSRAAREICHCYRRIYVGRPVGYTWEALHILFLAGLTYLHCIWASASVRTSTRQDEIGSTCMACTMVLVVMAERWKAAAPYRDIFEALASKTMSMAANQDKHPSDAHRAAVAATQQAEELDLSWELSQWVSNIPDVEMSDGMETFLTALIGNVRPDTGTVIHSEVFDL